MKDIILFGVQGSGKGTQGKILAKKNQATVFDTGSALRSIAARGSELGNEVKSIIDSGNLVSTEVVMRVIEDFMDNAEDESVFVFDGIPRNFEQYEQFEVLMEKVGRKPNALLIDIPREIAENRLLKRKMCRGCQKIFGSNFTEKECDDCGGEVYVRADDNAEAIKHRIDVFFSDTVPVIKRYESENRVIRVDGTPEVVEVATLIEDEDELFA